jgi:very-short-patch-repair endonuclease
VDLPTHPLEPHRVDRLFRVPPLIVEGDGRLWHARLATMDRDRQRDRRALRLGYPTVRYGWHELVHSASEVQEELLDLLGLSWSARHSPRSARSA